LIFQSLNHVCRRQFEVTIFDKRAAIILYLAEMPLGYQIRVGIASSNLMGIIRLPLVEIGLKTELPNSRLVKVPSPYATFLVVSIMAAD
jgi:hypothetical protein